MTSEEAGPYDAHVVLANKVFRDCGFTLAAMQFPRCHDALVALKRVNGLKADAKVPFAWGFFPNQWMRDNWKELYARSPKHFAALPSSAP